MKRIGLLLVVLLAVVMLPLPGEGSAAGPVTVQSNGVSYANLELAYKAASDDDVLIVTTSYNDTSFFEIKKDLTIIGAGGSHTVNMLTWGLYVTGGCLTLGDGGTENVLTISHEGQALNVYGGAQFHLRNGARLYDPSNSFSAVYMRGPGASGKISGGIIEANNGIHMEGASISEISGGTINCKQFAIGMGTNAGGKIPSTIGEISGGRFIQNHLDSNEGKNFGAAVKLSDGSSIGKISGGYFEAIMYAPLVVIDSAYIDEISGGEFVTKRDPWPGGGIQVVHNVYHTGLPTHIKKISGGHVYGGYAGLRVEGNGAQIGQITGGEFFGTIAMYNTLSASIGEISGGVFDGVYYGIYNDNRIQIDSINGGIFKGWGALYNINNSVIKSISGGEFKGSRGIYIDQTSSINQFSGVVFVKGDATEGIHNLGKINSITDGEFVGERHGIYNDISGSIDTISRGKFEGGSNGVYNHGKIGLISGGTLSGYDALSNMGNAMVTEISGGTFTGTCALYNTSSSGITTISGGSFTGKYYGIHNNSGLIDRITGGTYTGVYNDLVNDGIVKQISNGTFDGKGSGIFNGPTGKIGVISGGTYVNGGYGILNRGVIDLISGGRMIGNWIALSCEKADSYAGSVDTISGGVFWSKGNYEAIRLISTVKIEPNLEKTAVKGVGRFWGINGRVFNNNALTVLPEGFVMSTVTEPVDGLAGVEFEYLHRIYNVTFDTDGGNWDGDSTPLILTVLAGDSVGQDNMPPPPVRNGYTFEGWVDASGKGFDKDTIVTAAIEVFAKWKFISSSNTEDENKVTPKSIEVVLEAVKTVSGEGALLRDGHFDFTVYEGDTVVATGRNNAMGRIAFSGITYTAAGVHTYRVVETSTGGDGWSGDGRVHHVVVKVINSGNVLSAEVVYPDGVVPTFHNEYSSTEKGVYTAVLRVAKILLDQEGAETDPGLEFFVVLYEQADGGDWSEIGEYTVAANSPGVMIPGLLGGKTYQLVERTNTWYNVLGMRIIADNSEAGRVSGAAIAVAVPVLTNNTLLEVEISNQKTGEPVGEPEAARPLDEPPLVEIMDLEAPLASFTSEHVSYVVGYPGGKVEPELNITRAEASTILYRLLSEETRETYWEEENPFPDVERNMWHNIAVSVMYNLDFLKGFPDGTFRPDKAITRGEFAAIAGQYIRSMGQIPLEYPSFSDVDNHWAKDDIIYAAAAGLVGGFPDGTFKPDQNITRAETMALVNRMLERIPETAEDLLLNEMIVWPDNLDPEKWYYTAVQEATNSHLHDYKGDYDPVTHLEFEYWTELTPNPDWVRMERIWIMMYSR